MDDKQVLTSDCDFDEFIRDAAYRLLQDWEERGGRLTHSHTRYQLEAVLRTQFEAIRESQREKT